MSNKETSTMLTSRLAHTTNTQVKKRSITSLASQPDKIPWPGHSSVDHP